MIKNHLNKTNTIIAFKLSKEFFKGLFPFF